MGARFRGSCRRCQQAGLGVRGRAEAHADREAVARRSGLCPGELNRLVGEAPAANHLERAGSQLRPVWRAPSPWHFGRARWHWRHPAQLRAAHATRRFLFPATRRDLSESVEETCPPFRNGAGAHCGSGYPSVLRRRADRGLLSCHLSCQVAVHYSQVAMVATARRSIFSRESGPYSWSKLNRLGSLFA